MRNFLQIVGDAWEETGLSGKGPASVTKATGKEKRMCGWVRQAWIDIQEYRSDWPWMQKVFTFTTSADKPIYPLTELNITDLESWILRGVKAYETAVGPEFPRRLDPTTYEYYWDVLSLGPQTPSVPAVIFFDPADNSLQLHPTPAAEYTIRLRYHRAPQVLADNTDVPLMPTNTSWQEIIKWKALMYYAFHDGAPALYDEAEAEYENMIHKLDNRFGPRFGVPGSPIA